jgi:hypothetical protein
MWWTSEVTTWEPSTGTLGFHYLNYDRSWDTTFNIHNPNEMIKIRYHEKNSQWAVSVTPNKELLNLVRRYEENSEFIVFCVYGSLLYECIRFKVCQRLQGLLQRFTQRDVGEVDGGKDIPVVVFGKT